MRGTRALLIVVGTLSLGFGIVGIFLPLLPTTPFLLLAAACYARSSERLHRRLLEDRLVGKPIRDYRERGGLSPATKALTLALLWATLGVSAGLMVSALPARALLLAVGVGVTAHILSLRTIRG